MGEKFAEMIRLIGFIIMGIGLAEAAIISVVSLFVFHKRAYSMEYLDEEKDAALLKRMDYSASRFFTAAGLTFFFGVIVSLIAWGFLAAQVEAREGRQNKLAMDHYYMRQDIQAKQDSVYEAGINEGRALQAAGK